MSDASFNKKPTIELLFITGFKSLDGGPDDNHSLFLRRILCVKVHPSLPISEVALHNFIIAQQEHENDAMEVDVESPQETTEGTTVERTMESTTGHEERLDQAEGATIEPTFESTAGHQESSVQAEEATILMTIDHETSFEPSPPSTLNASPANEPPSTMLNSGQEVASQSNDAESEDINETYDNVMYDDKSERFFTGRFDSNLSRYLEKTVIEDVSTIDDRLLEDAKGKPNTWVSVPLGDPGDDPPPDYLITKVKCLYEQLEKPGW